MTLRLIITLLSFTAIACRDESSPSPEGLASSEEGLDLAHGNRQVASMLSSRPIMKELAPGREITREDVVWRWAAQRFAGLETGTPVYWNSDPPNPPSKADSRYPTSESDGWIRVRDVAGTEGLSDESRRRALEKLWASVVFELFNVANGQEFLAIYREAFKGGVRKDAWIERNLRLEHKALRRRAKFYWEIWKPFASQNGVRSDASNWRVSTPEDYEDWIRRYTDASPHPADYWGRYYDEKIVPYLSRLGLSP